MLFTNKGDKKSKREKSPAAPQFDTAQEDSQPEAQEQGENPFAAQIGEDAAPYDFTQIQSQQPEVQEDSQPDAQEQGENPFAAQIGEDAAPDDFTQIQPQQGDSEPTARGDISAKAAVLLECIDDAVDRIKRRVSDRRRDSVRSKRDKRHFAGIRAKWRKFRNRLPSFKPKEYVMPEPSYSAEKDELVSRPTLASDIDEILQKQNDLGEVVQEYEEMRRYINSVSETHAPSAGEIAPPERMGEVYSAQRELFDLIDHIGDENERQRGQIGVYSAPPAQDPYNYRGINDSRQFRDVPTAPSFSVEPSMTFYSQNNISEERLEYERRQREQMLLEASEPEPENFDLNSAVSDELQRFDDGVEDMPQEYADGQYQSDFGYAPEGQGEGLETDFDDDFDYGSGGEFDGSEYALEDDFELGEQYQQDEGDFDGAPDDSFDEGDEAQPDAAFAQGGESKPRKGLVGRLFGGNKRQKQ